MSSTVSVLVAAYKPDHFDQALRSACAQTYRDLEIIVVDDSPADEIRKVVDSVRDPRVSYIKNPENVGTAASYRTALETCRANWVAILNDDDIWEPSFVERLTAALNSEPGTVLAFADHFVVRDGRRDLEESDRLSRLWGRDSLAAGRYEPFRDLVIRGSIPLAVAALFDRSAVADLPIPLEVGGAYDFWLSYVLARDGRAAVYVRERLAAWRVHSTNLTGVVSVVRAREGVALHRTIASDHAYDDVRQQARALYARSLWTLATRCLLSGQKQSAVNAISEALRDRQLRTGMLLPLLLLPSSWLAWMTKPSRPHSFASRSTHEAN